MIGELAQLASTDPDQAADMVRNSAESAGRIAGHALGLTADEITSIGSRGIPTPIVAIVCAGLGAALAMRYAPDAWIRKIRQV
jgi:hypothetical protein